MNPAQHRGGPIIGSRGLVALTSCWLLVACTTNQGPTPAGAPPGEHAPTVAPLTPSAIRDEEPVAAGYPPPPAHTPVDPETEAALPADDDAMVQEFCEILARSPGLSEQARAIRVSRQDGVLRLNGRAATDSERDLILRRAVAIAGEAGVVDQIEVMR